MLSLEEIKELVRILETSSLNKMELAYEDGKVLLEKEKLQSPSGKYRRQDRRRCGFSQHIPIFKMGPDTWSGETAGS